MLSMTVNDVQLLCIRRVGVVQVGSPIKMINYDSECDSRSDVSHSTM